MLFNDAAFLILILLSTIMREIELPFFTRNNVVGNCFGDRTAFVMTFARLTRAAILTLREMDYVKASISLGASHLRVITRHIFAQYGGITGGRGDAGIELPDHRRIGAQLSGIWHPTSTPSWGNLLSNASEHFIKHPWLAIFPGLMIFFTIHLCELYRDGLRDHSTRIKYTESWRSLI